MRKGEALAQPRSRDKLQKRIRFRSADVIDWRIYEYAYECVCVKIFIYVCAAWDSSIFQLKLEADRLPASPNPRLSLKASSTSPLLCLCVCDSWLALSSISYLSQWTRQSSRWLFPPDFMQAAGSQKKTRNVEIVGVA